MGLLGEIYSFGNRTRNKLRGLLDDPMGSIQQTADAAAEGMRNITGQNEVAQQFALRDKINAGDQNALAEYKRLRGQVNNKLLDLATNFNPAAVGMTAWHGSPHKFDKFDLSKIGTGEGAQAYGHGAYLAENLDTAKAYQSATAAKDSVKITPKFSQEFWDRFDVPPADIRSTAQQMIQQEAFNPGYIKQIAGDDSYMGIVAKNILNGGIERPTGHLYKTDIPDEAVARFLDWDKPLSQQAPEVQKALKNIGVEIDDGVSIYQSPKGKWIADNGKNMSIFSSESEALQSVPKISGKDIWNRLKSTIPLDKSDALKNAGIPGIRYLDSGSRGTGQGTSNFVVFDPDMIRILERNGQATGAQPWAPGEWGGRLSP